MANAGKPAGRAQNRTKGTSAELRSCAVTAAGVEDPGPADRGGETGFGLPRSARLIDSSDFQEVFRTERRFRGRFLILLVGAAGGAALRVGVITGKRSLRRSVDRSRARRLLREAFRLNRHRIRGARDVILIARYTIHGASRQDVERDLLKVAGRAGLLADE